MLQADTRYLDHFGLVAPPFGPAPDPAFLFWSPAHRMAHAVLDYGLVSGAPVTVLTGEVGSGKTTLLAHFLGQLDADVTAGLVATPRPGGADILSRISDSFGLDPTAGDPFEALGAVLQAEVQAGRRLLAVIDEAQNLDLPALEDLRLLGNLAADGGVMLQLLLVGQPPLLRRLRAPELAPFCQRIAVGRHLGALDLNETGGYIAARLQLAGASLRSSVGRPPRSCTAPRSGLPRLVNQICDLALTSRRPRRLTSAVQP